MKDDDLPEGMHRLEKQPPFSLEPEDIAWRMRANWLDSIDRGHNDLQDIVLTHLEREAVHRLRMELVTEGLQDEPKIRDGYDDWIAYWWNEAFHNCEQHHPVGDAGPHLSQIGAAAVNVLMASSALREAIQDGKAEKSAALAMLIFAEALMGGYSLKYEATAQANEAIKSAKLKAYRRSIGRSSQDMQRLRVASVDFAAKNWAQKPTLRIGEMAKEFLERTKEVREKFPELEKFPTIETIKSWFKAAAAAGKLTIPKAAQGRGRPCKPK